MHQTKTNFKKSDLKKVGLAASGTTYTFHYLDLATTGAIDFGSGDTANVTIGKGLAVGKSGTLTLDVLEGGAVKLHGEKANVTLAAGANSLDLPLKQVDSTVPAEAALTLNLSIQPDTPVPTPAPAPAPTPAPAPAPGGDGFPTTWDAKSFLGNSQWTVSAQ